MYSSIPIVTIIVVSLCAATSILNSIFLAVAYIENKNSPILKFSNDREILSYLIYSVSVAVFIISQLITLLSRNFDIIIWVERMQFFALACIVSIYIFFPGFVFQRDKIPKITVGILLFLVALTMPVIFTKYFVIYNPVWKTPFRLQGEAGILYWPVLSLYFFVAMRTTFLSIYLSVKVKRENKKLGENQKWVMIGSIIALLGTMNQFLGDLHIIKIPGFTEVAGLMVGLTMMSILISLILMKEYSQTLKNLFTHHQLINEKSAKIDREYRNLLSTIVTIQEQDDIYLAGHSQRVMEFSVELAKSLDMGAKFIDDTRTAAILHDIGKVGVSKTILEKKGRLTEDEYLEVQKHPVLGYKIVSRYDPFKDIAVYVRFHHEKLDASGYPDGISDERIPHVTRILTVADIYDALHSERPYRKALSNEKCFSIMDDMAAGNKIDKRILKKLKKIVISK